VVYESACFHRRVQNPDETIDQYVTALQTLVDRCDYGDFKQRMLCNRLVVSIRDGKLSETLQMDSQLTLASALAKAWLKETVRQQQRELRPEESPVTSEDVNIDAVRRYSGTSWRQGSEKLACSREWYCSSCGGNQPPRSACPARAAKCFNCSNRGRFSKICRTGAGKAQKVDSGYNWEESR
ncbi:uncharacterized protein LOC120843447, partial [Ixodes scapularis]|uniref:uncharacterized protein LOC120843447 n=1 Tax=Ixodes scapularis TaxID=6945 RepID=UPI001A9D4ED4